MASPAPPKSKWCFFLFCFFVFFPNWEGINRLLKGFLNNGMHLLGVLRDVGRNGGLLGMC